MLLTPAQDKIASCRNRFRVVCSGRRFGKTALAVEEIKGKALSKPNKIAYIGPTIQQTRDLAWALLNKELHSAIISTNETRLELKTKTIKGGESLIYLRGWENIETIRGMDFDFIVMDECAMMRNFWGNWQEVIRPTLTDRRGEALFCSTPKGFNHYYDLYNLERDDKDFKSFHFTTYDNPFIPRDELEKAKQELTEDRFAQEYMADFRKTEGLVYKEFNRERHVFSDFNIIRNRQRTLDGIDWGYTNPCAILEVVEDSDRSYYVISEFYKAQKTTAEIVEYAASLKGNAYYPDPAEPDRNAELVKAGLNVQEVNKDVAAGIDAVRNLFKNNKLFIHESCKNLILELETYAYKEQRADQNTPEEPIKDNDHALDALRYVLFMATATFRVRNEREELQRLRRKPKTYFQRNFRSE